MERIVYSHAQENPDAPAIESGDVTLTYSDLVTQAISFAELLNAEGIKSPEEPIGILLGPGIEQVIVQLAVRLIGATCVPIEPTLPECRIADMLNQVHVRYIVTEENGPLTLPQFHTVHIRSDRKTEHEMLPNWEFCPETDRSHILFTSGSTGKPKPVQIRAVNILHLATRTPVTPLLRSDRVAEFNNPGFDLSLFEIWATLLSGATIVAVPRHIATDTGGISSYLQEHDISVIFITAALFSITVSTCPSTFATLRHVLMGGDVANIPALRSLFASGPPQHLWNTYGPTECTTMTTMHEVTLEDTKSDRIPIGRPVGDMEVFLLDDDQQPIVDPGKHREIYIAGPQQAAGYFGRPAENTEQFVQIDQLDNDNKSCPVQVYRTGDRGRRGANSDVLDFLGRTDTQVKHGGFRVELGEIERILQDHPALHTAVVVRQPPSTAVGTYALIAFVAVDQGNVDAESLLRFARERLPSYMIPDAVEVMTEFPLTPNGKVDRNALLQRRLDAQEQQQQTATQQPSGNTTQDKNDKRSVLRDIWIDILNVPSVEDNEDFFQLGATSMQAAALIALIQTQLNHLISMEELYRSSRFSQLLSLLEPTDVLAHGNAPDDTRIWMEDVDLVKDIVLLPDWQSPDEGRVFLTGATGFVGAHLLHRLMHRPTVQQIACLSRPQGTVSAAQRIRQTMEKYDLWPTSPHLTEKLLVLSGDLSDDTFGLGHEKFAWLANWASVIFHLGAKVNFCESYREHRPANIVGTRNALRLAATSRRKPFHYMSSVDAWGPTGCILGTPEVREDGPLKPHIQGLRYDLGYAQSQWTAEAMVRRMRDEHGLPIAIYRPGFIIGDGVTGASNPNDFVTRLVVGCVQMGTFPRLTQCLEYVTVDYAVEAMLHIAADNTNLGRSYHIVPPDPKTSVTVEETCRVINEAGYPVKLVDYEEWAAQAVRDQHGEDAALAPLMPMVQERVLGRLTRWEASQYTPWYRADNTSEALKNRPDLVCRLLDANMLRRFISFWSRKGFYQI
ncbi:hypothetical protein FE257_001490 [Aspergillus nanangensis]|uniref:Carrier domain-containing protein n=1 Tax=Aspergillus nanangensis TaxID=2582783 RepID=A0AAD4GPK7_ASPNN|nr:hypothetical protein FE257_001490 [Aspergillus nanangensis]